MIFTLIRYTFRAFLRNSVEKFNAVSLLPFLVFIYFIFISFLSGRIINEAAVFQPSEVLFGYLIFDIVLKFILPIPYSLPYEYLYLPTNRKILINYIVLLNTLFSPFLLFTISFWTGYFLQQQLIDNALAINLFFLTSISTIVCLGLKANLFNVKTILNLIIHISCIYLFQKLQYSLYINIIIEIMVFLLSYIVCFHLLSKQVSIDYFDFMRQSSFFLKGSWLPNKLSLFKLDWQLVIRNKRPLTYFILAFLYVLFFFSTLIEIEPTSPFFGFLLSAITSIFIIQYGQFSFCWEGSFFDFFLVFTNIKMIITEKFNFFYSLLFLNMCLLLLMIAISGQFSFELIFLITLSILFHAAVTVPILIVLSFFQQRKINLEKGAFLNYEGTSGITFIIIICTIVPFGILYLTFSYILSQQNIAWVLAGVIACTFGCQNVIRKSLLNRMRRNAKYQLSENFN